MVASGFFLDEAFGEIKDPSLDNKVKKKKKKVKQDGPVVFDRSYNKIAKDIRTDFDIFINSTLDFVIEESILIFLFSNNIYFKVNPPSIIIV